MIRTRPKAATFLACFLVVYGASASAVAALLRPHDPNVGLVLLGALVCVFAGLTGIALWRLAPHAETFFLLWVSSLTLFNVRLFTPLVLSDPEAWPFFLLLGIAAVAVLGLLYLYVRQVCRAV